MNGQNEIESCTDIYSDRIFRRKSNKEFELKIHDGDFYSVYL